MPGPSIISSFFFHCDLANTHANTAPSLSVNTLDQQLDRAYDQYTSRESDLRKNSFLQSLKGERGALYSPLRPTLTKSTAQNQVLFYNLLTRHLEEMARPPSLDPFSSDANLRRSSPSSTPRQKPTPSPATHTSSVAQRASTSPLRPPIKWRSISSRPVKEGISIW